METVRDKMASRQHDLKLYLEWTDPAMKAQVRLETRVDRVYYSDHMVPIPSILVDPQQRNGTAYHGLRKTL